MNHSTEKRINTSYLKLFKMRTNMQTKTVKSPINECAYQVLDVVPLVMRVIRRDLRRHGAFETSVPHFRTLAFLFKHEGASLSEVSEHIGLGLPAMSVLVDGLVFRGLVNRRTDRNDRRRMILTLTESGRSRMTSAREATVAHLELIFRQLSAADRTTILRAMHVLKELLSTEE